MLSWFGTGTTPFQVINHLTTTLPAAITGTGSRERPAVVDRLRRERRNLGGERFFVKNTAGKALRKTVV
jgi:hypothetical protein